MEFLARPTVNVPEGAPAPRYHVGVRPCALVNSPSRALSWVVGAGIRAGLQARTGVLACPGRRGNDGNPDMTNGAPKLMRRNVCDGIDGGAHRAVRGLDGQTGLNDFSCSASIFAPMNRCNPFCRGPLSTATRAGTTGMRGASDS